MDFMDIFKRGMEKTSAPVVIKLDSQVHVPAICDASIPSLPATMASLLVILINFAILLPDGFIASILYLGAISPYLAEVQQIFTPVMNGPVNITAVLITFLVVRNMAISYQQDDLLCNLMAIGVFLAVYTPYTIIDGQIYPATKYLSPQGLFVAITVVLISGEVPRRLARNPGVTITIPAAVPPAVARSFKVLLPTFFVIILFSTLNYLLMRISPNDLNDLIYTLIQAPLKNMGANVVTVLVPGLVANLLQVPGTHGPNTVAIIRETIFSEASLEDLLYAIPHGSTWGAPHPTTQTSINDALVNCNGSGMTLGLLLVIFTVSRHNDYRDLAKMVFVSGPFNTNEPAMFGLSIVLNPILVIPFVLVPFVNSLIGYLFISMEFIPSIVYAMFQITPGPPIAFSDIGDNWLALFAGILCLAVSVFTYLSSVITANRINTTTVTDQEDGDACR